MGDEERFRDTRGRLHGSELNRIIAENAYDRVLRERHSPRERERVGTSRQSRYTGEFSDPFPDIVISNAAAISICAVVFVVCVSFVGYLFYEGLHARTSGRTGRSVPIAPAPVIDSVSPIVANRAQTIHIRGRNFGRAPQLRSLGGGFVDTVACNTSAPSLAIRQLGRGAENWSAGQAGCSDPNLIGIRLISWTDTDIVIGGFGPLLGSESKNTRWRIVAGDKIEVDVIGAEGSGITRFQMVVQPDDSA